MNLYPGKMVLYRWRPGQVRAGNIDAAAMITRVHTDGMCDLTIYPAMDRDPVYQSRVARMSEVVQSHCWHPVDDDKHVEELERRVAKLEGLIGTITAPDSPARINDQSRRRSLA